MGSSGIVSRTSSSRIARHFRSSTSVSWRSKSDSRYAKDSICSRLAPCRSNDRNFSRKSTSASSDAVSRCSAYAAISLAESKGGKSVSPEGATAVMAGHIARLNPADGVECAMIEEMVASHWRPRRAWAIEARMLEKQIAAQTAAGDLDRTANAFSALADPPATALMYQRAMHNLLLRVIELPNEPNPISGHRALPAAPEAEERPTSDAGASLP